MLDPLRQLVLRSGAKAHRRGRRRFRLARDSAGRRMGAQDPAQLPSRPHRLGFTRACSRLEPRRSTPNSLSGFSTTREPLVTGDIRRQSASQPSRTRARGRVLCLASVTPLEAGVSPTAGVHSTSYSDPHETVAAGGPSGGPKGSSSTSPVVAPPRPNGGARRDVFPVRRSYGEQVTRDMVLCSQSFATQGQMSVATLRPLSSRPNGGAGLEVGPSCASLRTAGVLAHSRCPAAQRQRRRE